ncbi:MAG TPA: hypothetical protein VLY04_21090 [Bryobacteraceae bacterium]|nr:hypothetical protein [Bryobacteraceae bacterium]
MNRNARVFCFLALTLAAVVGCSSQPPAKESKKAESALQTIQGKAQVLDEQGGAMDAALNAGGSSVYLWVGTRRYRLFLRTPFEVVHGDEYSVDGIYAQKVIDDIGDPDQGKNGYPLQTSCERVVKMAWNNLAFDEIDSQASVLRGRVQRYPARAVFLVTRIRLVTPAADAKKDTAAKEKNVPEVSVAAEKQKALLIEGPTVQTAPLWEPTGGTARCSVVIGTDGKISDLETGAQLCESVPWDLFRYQPPVQGGHPVKVKTDVEIKFEPRK